MANKNMDMIALILVVIGGLNWGLVGILNFNLVSWLFTDTLGVDILSRIVYIVVGIAALYEIYILTQKK